MELPMCHMRWLLSCYLLLPWILESVTPEVLPSFVVEPESQVVKKNAEVVLSCQVAPPTAEIRWKYNGHYIEPSTDDRMQIRADNSLHISAFKAKRHAGTYMCGGSTPEGTILSRPAKLHRARLGHFTNGGQSRGIEVVVVNATEGNTAVIPCEIPKGEPTPVAIFEINSTTIDKSTERYKLHPSGNLHIGAVRQSDQGLYSCIVKNTVSGKKKDSTKQIQLKISTPLANVGPRFILPPPKNTEVILGSTLTLECAVGGSPVPRVSWDKYGGQLPEGRFRQEFGTLLIENVQIQDIGTYICSGDNEVDSAVTAIAMVDVLVPPEITNAPSNKVVTVGDTVTFHCETYGTARIKTQWVHDGEPVPDTDQSIQVQDTSITVSNIQMRHSGIWQCLVSNKYGATYAYAMLTVIPSNSTTNQPPGGSEGEEEGTSSSSQNGVLPPTMPEVLQIEENMVLLKWSVPLNLQTPVKYFKVQYKEEGVWKTHANTSACSTCMFSLQGLRTGIPYKFRIAAVYSNGEELVSPNTERFKLLQAPKIPDDDGNVQDIQPDDGPVSPSAVTTSSSIASTNSGSNNGDSSNSNMDGVSSNNDHPNKPIFTLRPANTERKVGEMAVLYCIAEGADELRWRQEGRPLRPDPRHIIEDGSLKIFNVQPWESGAYMCVAVNRFGFSIATAHLLVTGNATIREPASVDRSRDNPRYKQSTLCTTQRHPPTTPSSRGENQGHRGSGGRKKVPPSRPAVTQLSDSSVMLEWSVPPNDGLRVTLFRVQYKRHKRRGNKGRWRTIDEDIPDNQFRYELRGLSLGHSYKFRIAAVYSNNDNAVGPTSPPFTLVAGPTSHPSAPEVGPVIVQVKPSAYAMEIEWQYAHHIGEGPIDGFWIHYKPYNAPDSQSQKVTVPPVETKYRIIGLTPDTQYSFKMQCFNLAGASDFSNKVAMKTLAADGSQPMFTPFPTGILTPVTRPPGNGLGPHLDDGQDDVKDDNAVPANSTQKSNELLYMVLGVVLGVMMLLLVIFMVMCAWKQRQQRRMMAAALDANARYKFQDPSQRIHNDSMRAKHGNGFLLNGLNGKTPNGHLSNGHAGNGHIPNGNGKMNINVNPMTQLEPLHNSDNEEEAISENESNPDDPYTTQSTLPHRPLQTFGYPNDSNYNTLERNPYPSYHDNNTEHMNSNIPQSRDHIPSDPPDYSAIRLHNNYVHRSHDHISGVRGQTPRSHDLGTTSEHSYPSQGSAKHKRRRKRPSREQQSPYTGTQMKDQATNTDLSSNEGTLDSSFTYPSQEGHHQDRTQPTPIPHSDYRHSPDMYSVE
ncbi:interference hedgehog isoform X1 [Lingula anatina]|uniref:Interference hedgehog isoform X1 n=1 Tax=Lingula anatina TaxID=7574 RepID=A0A1S3JN26_LINAN|nr:interference hedgehog isoform X1 [Lingula anatina]XP_013411338.1 interference hedgehog isoform X1 [Lingula anatina]XP_013411339.1 interference hedgehog isoform X1 [Lingula anatina]XP_013411340.1 interference hedgehog isoform X1 [Lingula anatina]XP_013411341.1 interference hedgehog isoform X1 [Lingula anatina]XP_013411343.1 interference hedgehog isoform X1 [Lingula anatina]XP_013411344.1 interference hedgehog isoform X1 [Lingula anatina]XP_013411346.1 interference hedgehog isoform X1 [Ling|eukprot:XP_013411337.1 interference hedgehog isoform X1 [Lingula anatina]